MEYRLDNIPVVNLGFVIDGQSTVDGCAVENDDFYSNNRHIKSHPKNLKEPAGFCLMKMNFCLCYRYVTRCYLVM